MSIYDNPVYNNPTSIPYTKLNEEEKPQLLHGLITLNTPTKEYYRRRHRIASAISCILCSLAITLTCLAAVLALYGVFGRCFRAEDIDTEDFEKFMQMLQPKRERQPGQRKFDVSQRVMPFPRIMPGPVIPPPFGDHKILHAMCPVMNTIECHRESFDGYSLKEHQQRVDLLLGKNLLSGRLNTSYAVNTARHSYKQCVKDFDGEKQSILRHFANRLMEIKDYKHRSEESAKLLAELTILGRLEFGIDTLFKVEVSANYMAPDGEHPYVMYLSQKLPDAPTAAQMSMLRRAFRGKLNETSYQQIHLNIPRIREMSADSDDSMSWKSFTAAEAYARWSFFDWHAYLSSLNSMQRFSHDVKEFVFVVKTPTYFDKLNAFFLAKNGNETQQKVELFKVIEMYNIFADNDKFLGIENEENEIRRKYQLGDPLKTLAAPYRFIYSYNEGHASYDAIRFCSKYLRTHLPHISSAVFSESNDNQVIKAEIQRFEGMIESARDELISWVNESNVNQSLKDVLTDKLRKLGISFTTRESLERDSFEEAHRKLNWEQIETESFLEMVPVINNFLFKRLLDRLNSKIEALRSSVFSEASAATIDLEYSRLGNWLNVPSSLLTSPLLASTDTPRTLIYSNLFWTLGRELSKAIDYEGVLYNSVGVHKRGEIDLKPLEQMWTEAQTCLEQNLYSSRRDGTSRAIVIRQSINEIVGFQVAYRSFDKAIKEVFGKDTKHRSKDDLQTNAVKSFFQTSTSVYCQAGERGASIILLDKFVDSYIKRHKVLGCTPTYMNFDCKIQLSDQQ